MGKVTEAHILGKSLLLEVDSAEMTEKLQIMLLGGLRAVLAGQSITRFRTQKTASLFAYLAFYPDRSHARDELVEQFWPDDDIEAARASLRTALSSLRRQLEPPGTPAGSILVTDRASVSLNPAAVTVDTVEFQRALQSAGSSGGDLQRREALSRAVEYYGGELLPGFYDDWILSERERLAQAYRRALRQLSSLLAAAGDTTRAIDCARRAFAADRLDEAACVELMRLLIAAGQPAAALQEYQALERALREELSATPSTVTRKLAAELALESQQQAVGETGPTAPATTPVWSRAGPSTRVTLPVQPPDSPLAPTGTVTFLRTDIEGASTLRQRAGEAFELALATCHRLLRAEFHRFGGYEASAGEASFLVAFHAAGDALACAMAGQRVLAAHVWPEAVGRMSVRMGLHSGDVEWAAGIYQGPAIHHAARISEAAHPGQILCSEVTARLLRTGDGRAATARGDGTTGLGMELMDLGIYRLQGLTTPERLFQVTDPSQGPQQFPPPRAQLDTAGHLPLQFTRFFGREEELLRLRDLLLAEPARLVTLTGPGGSGKTRLAIEIARQMTSTFGSAIWFVGLADALSADQIPQMIADTMHLERSASLNPLPQVAQALGGRRALLVLDNFEHLVEEGAAVLRELLQTAPTVTCLVTSRQRLNLAGEQEFLVNPLPVPTGPRTPEGLLECPSVQLFVDRARAVRPDFQVTARNAAAVATLCARLEGIPLALELAAAWAQMLTPEQMVAQLSERVDFLVSRRRDVAPRHRTLRAAMTWSVEGLPPELRHFFAQLSVFRGGWTLAAAGAVTCRELGSEPSSAPAGAGRQGMLACLTELGERSLIGVTDLNGEMRYRMLESLREYAAELLPPDEQTALRRRHAEYYIELAEMAFPLLHGPEQTSWLDRLEIEHDNFRAALSWCLTEPDVRELGQRLAAALHFFWYVRGYAAEGRRWLASCLAASDSTGPTPARAGALYGAARLASLQGDLTAAYSLYEKSLADWRALGDWISVARTLCQWGNVAEWNGDRVAARSLYSQSLAICRELKDQGLLAHVLKCLGLDALVRGDGERAHALYEESLDLYRQIGNLRGVTMVVGELARLAISRAENERADALLQEYLQLARQLKDAVHTANALGLLGRVTSGRGDHSAARSFLTESLDLRRELGERHEMAPVLLFLADSTLSQGDLDAARAYLKEGRTLLNEIRDPLALSSCLNLLAAVAVRREESSTLSASTALRAARLLGAADAFRAPINAAELWPAEGSRRERCVALVRARLAPQEFATAWAEGSAMTPEQAVQEARRIEL